MMEEKYVKTIKEILAAKGSQVWTVDANTSVFDALNLMAEKNIGSVAVLDGGRLAGMFTERDYARNLILKERSSRSTPIRDVMTRRVAVVNPVQTLDECMALMTEKHLRHLPVMEQGELVGILSIGDLVKATIEDQQFMIEQLVNYISG